MVKSHRGDSLKSELMGYHDVYHGTTRNNAKSILKDSIRPRFGGDPSKGGEASSAPKYISNSKGKAFLTKSTNNAKWYSRTSSDPVVLHGTIPHHKFEAMHEDTSVFGSKGNGFYSHNPISSKRFSKDTSKYATLGNIKRYLKSGTGRSRFTGALLRASKVGGVGALAVVPTAASLYLLNKARSIPTHSNTRGTD